MNPLHKIVSYDYRTKMHAPLLEMFKEHNIGIDFVRDMGEAVQKINNMEYLLMFIYTNDKGSISSLPVIRNITHMPIIVVSEEYDSGLRKHSLRTGADEYFPEPKNLQEGLLSALAHIRRHQEYSRKKTASTVLLDEHILLSTNQRKVFVKGVEIHLSFHEFEFLKLLFENRSIVLSYDKIYDYIHRSAVCEGDIKNTIQHVAGKVRKKLQSDGVPKYIRTIPNVGYAFDPEIACI